MVISHLYPAPADDGRSVATACRSGPPLRRIVKILDEVSRTLNEFLLVPDLTTAD
jgi:hypothetical protein